MLHKGTCNRQSPTQLGSLIEIEIRLVLKRARTYNGFMVGNGGNVFAYVNEFQMWTGFSTNAGVSNVRIENLFNKLFEASHSVKDPPSRLHELAPRKL